MTLRRLAWAAMTLVVALLGCKRVSKSDANGSAPEATTATTPSATTTASAAASGAAAPETACSQATACCKLVAAKSGQSPRECDKFQKYSEKSCASSLAQLQQAGKILGLDCKAAAETK